MDHEVSDLLCCEEVRQSQTERSRSRKGFVEAEGGQAGQRYHYEVLTKHGEEYLLTVVRPKLIKK